MKISKPFSSLCIRFLIAGIWGVVCLLIVSAPYLAANSHNTAAAAVYFSFSGMCHQIQERSFFALGFPLAVCHRCFGIYFGLLLGALIPTNFIHQSVQIRRIWVLAASMPLLLDFLLPHFGLWASTQYGRFTTGLLFGTVVSSLLVRGVIELLNEPFWRPLSIFPISKEAFHE